MRFGAIELKGELGLGPVGVHLAPADLNVELRLGKVVALAELLDPLFRLASQEVRLGLVGDQDPAEAVAALAAG